MINAVLSLVIVDQQVLVYAHACVCVCVRACVRAWVHICLNKNVMSVSLFSAVKGLWVCACVRARVGIYLLELIESGLYLFHYYLSVCSFTGWLACCPSQIAEPVLRSADARQTSVH